MDAPISRRIADDVSLVICGEAGQGIQTVEGLLTRVLKAAGFNVFACKEYMSRVRGGSNSTEIRVSSRKAPAYVERIDVLIPLDRAAIAHLGERVTQRTVILEDREKIASGLPGIDVPFARLALESGGPVYANTVAIGLVLALFGVDRALLDQALEKQFASKGPDILQKNKGAGKRGYDLGLTLSGPGKIELAVTPDAAVGREIILSGSEAVALGALAGGCDFISAYPMTPSTGILTYLARHAAEFGSIAEQAEDEISAVNMALGAWYAGARAMVATAGGGFALMTEGLSLAGMIESPLVAVVGQRPSPATGLPTRTEQSDLDQAVYAGHGEFPRIVLAPGTCEEAYSLSAKAFALADRHQCPVLILTDQYLADSYYNFPSPAGAVLPQERAVIKTEPGYRRYLITENGISPRGIPGYGAGLVAVDSDEHDEDGHITESGTVRTAMVNKRLKKYEGIAQDALPPEFTGSPAYTTLVVGWGSTKSAIQEALTLSGRYDIGFLHFSQVYPVHQSAAGYLKKARHTIIVENNATAQFARLLHRSTGIDISEKILKYDGMPFSVEELAARFRKAPRFSARTKNRRSSDQ